MPLSSLQKMDSKRDFISTFPGFSPLIRTAVSIRHIRKAYMPHLVKSSRLFLLFFFLILASPTVFAMSEKERDQLRALPDWIPYVSCQEHKMLRQCVLWTQEDCELSTLNSTNSCLNLNKKDWMNPLTLTLEEWQQRIIDCVVNDTKSRFKSLIVESPACKNKGIRK